jgi:hypothetical protein
MLFCYLTFIVLFFYLTLIIVAFVVLLLLLKVHCVVTIGNLSKFIFLFSFLLVFGPQCVIVVWCSWCVITT